MSNHVNIQELGFNSWLELYDWLKEQKLHDEQKVTLTWPAPEVADVQVDNAVIEGTDEEKPDVTLTVSLIKAKAFEEIEAGIPSQAAVEVLKELVEDLATFTDGPAKLRPLLEFLNKLSTRP